MARLGVRRSMRTASVSPGSAPSTKIGPVIGFGRSADRNLVGIEARGVNRIRYHRIAVGDPHARLRGADDVEVAGRVQSVRGHGRYAAAKRGRESTLVGVGIIR